MRKRGQGMEGSEDRTAGKGKDGKEEGKKGLKERRDKGRGEQRGGK